MEGHVEPAVGLQRVERRRDGRHRLVVAVDVEPRIATTPIVCSSQWAAARSGVRCAAPSETGTRRASTSQ